ADPHTGQFPPKDQSGMYTRSLTVAAHRDDSTTVLLVDRYTVYDFMTDTITWEYITQAPVDPQTGAHLHEAYRGEYVVFPRQVHKQPYTLRTNYLKGLLLSFEREEVIEGLRTYLFTYTGRAEYTESYAGTAAFPGVTVAPGQDIRCRDDQFRLKMWVEPVTGELAKLEERCFSGDAIYDRATETPVTLLQRWGGVTAGDDVLLRVQHIQQERRHYLWAARYVPLVLVCGGLLACGGGFPRRPCVS